MKKIKNIKIEFLFEWFDFWVGIFYDKNKKWLYIFPIPMCGIVIKFKPLEKHFQTMHVEHHAVIPIKYKGDFILDEFELKYRMQAIKETEEQVARQMAARLLSGKIYDLILEDQFNNVFRLLKFNPNAANYYGRKKQYCIEMQIVPTVKENVPYDCKLVEPKI